MDDEESEPGDSPLELQHTPLQHTADRSPPPRPQPTRPADQHRPRILRTVRQTDFLSIPECPPHTQWPMIPFPTQAPATRVLTGHAAQCTGADHALGNDSLQNNISDTTGTLPHVPPLGYKLASVTTAG